jgi:hypothetical protein
LNIQKEPSRWTRDEAELFQDLLKNPVLQRAVSHVAFSRPSLLSGADINQTALRAAEVAGFEKALATFLSLQEPPPKEESPRAEAYPDLDDDSKWEPPIKQ